MSSLAKEPSVVVLGPKGMLEIWPNLPETKRTSAYAMAKGILPALRFYDAHGRVHRIHEATPPFRFGAVRQFLARTVYNPRFDVRLKYEQLQAYTLQDLKAQVLAAIALDDDIITQFHDAGEISRWVQEATSFEEIVAALRRAEQENDEA